MNLVSNLSFAEVLIAAAVLVALIVIPAVVFALARRMAAGGVRKSGGRA